MSGKSDTWENGWLLLFFNNVAFADVGDGPGLQPSGTVGSLYMSLHTQSPTVTGNQGSYEVTYASYARTAVPRASGAGGWSISGDGVSLVDDVEFTEGTAGGSPTATHFGIGSDISGSGHLFYFGELSPTIVTGEGVTPVIDSGLIIDER